MTYLNYNIYFFYTMLKSFNLKQYFQKGIKFLIKKDTMIECPAWLWKLQKYASEGPYPDARELSMIFCLVIITFNPLHT